MYDAVCPVCRSMIEIPAQAVESKSAHRCPKCWSWLRIVDAHPLRLEMGTEGDAVAGTSVRLRRLSRMSEEEEA